MTNPEENSRNESQADSPEGLSAEDSTADYRLGLFTQGPLKELMERFREHLVETAYNIAGREPEDPPHLEQAYDLLLSQDPNWSVKNRRRVYLIGRQASGKISPSELDELKELQVEADRHMSKVAPRPLERLWDLKEELLRRAADADEDTEEQ